jgi:hypothetical protein
MVHKHPIFLPRDTNNRKLVKSTATNTWKSTATNTLKSTVTRHQHRRETQNRDGTSKGNTNGKATIGNLSHFEIGAEYETRVGKCA